jgi:mannose-1-phosphate guanylyltransferase
VKIRYSLEPFPLGTGGPIAFARQYYRSERILAMNGDILAEINLDEMRRLHESNNALATIALHEVEDPTRFGVVRLDERSRINEFVEKPKSGDAPSRLINAGAYLLEPGAIDRIPKGRRVTIEREVFPALASEGKLSGYVHSGTWFDVGNIRDFRNANFASLESNARSRVIIGKSAIVSHSATLDYPAFIGDNTTIEDEARLGPLAIIGRRVLIRKRVSIVRTVVFDDVEIGMGSSVEGAVIGNNVRIGRGVAIGHGSVISGYVNIHDYVRVTSGAYIHPYKEISEDVQSPGHVV